VGIPLHTAVFGVATEQLQRAPQWKKTLPWPSITRTWNGNRQSNKSLLGASVTPGWHARASAAAWITLHLPHSPPVAALYMPSVLCSTDPLRLSFAPSSSCPCVEDYCSGASKILHGNFYIHPSTLSSNFSPSLLSAFSAHYVIFDALVWASHVSLACAYPLLGDEEQKLELAQAES